MLHHRFIRVLKIHQKGDEAYMVAIVLFMIVIRKEKKNGGWDKNMNVAL
jgi:hypothetical protein